MSLTPKNWAAFQHYTDRRPAWIKLHRGLLDDYDYACLPVASRALAPCLWLLASEYERGGITASLDEIAFRLRMSKADLIDALKPLVISGFFIDASGVLADCYQHAIPEKEKRERTSTERGREEKNAGAREGALVLSDFPSDAFAQFWTRYPHKIGKADAEKAFTKVSKSAAVTWTDLMDALSKYVSKTDDRPWCNPATWLRQARYADQPAASNGAPRPGSREDQRERTANAYAKLSEYVDAHTNDQSRSGGIDPSPLGLLPFAKPA